LTGTASININGTVGATTANTGAFTTLTTTGTINLITVGRGAGAVATNTAVGASALAANTSGLNSVAVGTQALFTNQTGQDNAAVGYFALYLNLSGTGNSAFGRSALQSNNSGGSNTAVGYQALVLNTTASNNTAVGFQAGYTQTTAAGNAFYGCQSGYGVTTGSKNVIIGSYQGSAAPISATGSNYIVLSDGDGNVRGTFDGSGNLGIGTTSPTSKLTVAALRTTSSGEFLGGINALDTTTGGAAGVGGVITLSGDTQGAGYKQFAAILGGKENSTVTDLAGFAAFYTRPGGGNLTERMRLDSSGNLGLGTVTPAYKLEVIGSARISSKLLLDTGTAALPSLTFTGWTNTGIYNPVGNSIGFSVNGSERARIDSSGNLLVGATATAYGERLNIVAAGAAASGGYFLFNSTDDRKVLILQHVRATGATSATMMAFLNASSAVVGSITADGTATLYNTTSDQRLKTNIVDAAPASALIDAIQVRQYDWKADGSHQRYGFVAQELVTVAPEAVHQPADPEAMMAVDYSKLVPMLVKEIQDLRKRLAAAGI
jgi:hypothetical protein